MILKSANKRMKETKVRKGSSGNYSFMHDGKKVIVEPKISVFPGGLTIVISLLAKTKNYAPLGNFKAGLGANDTWWVWHREIYEGYRGYLLGILGFRSIEKAIRKSGGKKIRMSLDQKDVLNAALKTSYNVAPKSMEKFRKILNLKQNEAVPNKEKISKFLHSDKCPYEIERIEVEKVLK